MSERQQLRFALAALVAGVAWGYLRNRRSGRSSLLALLQGLEWFVTYGGAAALIHLARETATEHADVEADADGERISHFRQSVTERTGTDG